MIAFKNIVVTTDLSENANEALPYAVDLARKYNGTLTLLHVCEDPAYYASAAAAEGFVVDVGTWTEKIVKEREEALKERAAQRTKEFDLEFKPVMRNGHASSEIVAFAKESKADVVVIATHGRTGLSHLVFGSVAERVIRHCPCAVLSVRPKSMKDA
jgi:universal stress protein A